jgi:hypothetical protein
MGLYQYRSSFNYLWFDTLHGSCGSEMHQIGLCKGYGCGASVLPLISGLTRGNGGGVQIEGWVRWSIKRGDTSIPRKLSSSLSL